MLIAMIILPLVFAFIIAVLPKGSIPIIRNLTYMATIAHLTMALVALLCVKLPMEYSLGGWERALGIWLFADHLSLLMTILASLLVLLAFSYSFASRIEEARYYSLILIMLASLTGWALTNDLFNMFVFIELASVTAYTLTAYERTKFGFEASLKYIVLGSLAGLFIFTAVLLLYFATGELNMTLSLSQIDKLSPLTALLVWVLLFVGLASKSGLAPMHMWLPDVHSSAPTPISVLLSAIVVKLGLFSLYRLYSLAYGVGQGPGYLLNIFLIIGCISILVGHLVAWQQDDIKRLLAYSTVAQIGYILIGLHHSQTSTIGALYHVANHALLKATLFFTAGYLSDLSGSRKIKDFQGLGYRTPAVTAAFALAAFGMVGIPPLNGFTSKWLIAAGLLEKGWNPAAVVIAVGTLISAVYYLQILRLFWSAPRENSQPNLRLGSKGFPITISLIGILVLTVMAPHIVSFLRRVM